MDATPKKTKLADWGALPQELMETVAERLGHREHVIPLRAVSKAWRNAIPSPATPSPVSLVDLPFPISVESDGESDEDEGSDRAGVRFRLFPSTLMYVEPWIGDGGWVVRLYRDSLPPGQTIRLRDPISPLIVEKLPEGCPASLYPLDYKVTVISESYSLHPVGLDPLPPCDHYRLPLKVAVSVSPFAVMVLHEVYDAVYKLAVWRSGEERWSSVEDEGFFNNITYFNGKFYAVDDTGRAVSVDPASLEVMEVADALDSVAGADLHLLESLGFLYMVELNDFEEDDCADDLDKPPMVMRVRRLDEENGIWALVNDLENRTFFVGDNSSCSVSVQDCPLLWPDTIYFDDSMNSYDHSNGNYPGSSCTIFIFEDGEVVGLDEETGDNYVNVFWPPPNWLV